MHTTCTRTTATTASGCHSLSTVLERANNNNTVVSAEGSSTHSARYGPAPVWHRHHRTHLTKGRAGISSLAHTNSHKWEENSVKQRPHARTPNHTRHNSDASWKFPHTRKHKKANYMLYEKSPQFARHKRTMGLLFPLHSPFIFPMRNPADITPPW
ncbi:hypothetical protein TcG_02323 [Trypanosoma cruzi]|nr:hypothetical protein TcG_02323 [Trypanosoma cruzi]